MIDNDPFASRLRQRGLATVLGIYLVILNLLFLTMLLLIWPGMGQIFPFEIPQPSEEARFLLISVLSAGLGSVIAVLFNFEHYVGDPEVVGRFAWFYVTSPLIGMTIGIFVYMAIRGGLLKANSNADALNPYTVAVIAASGGAFSRQIFTRLKIFAEDKLRLPPPPSSDANTGSTRGTAGREDS